MKKIVLFLLFFLFSSLIAATSPSPILKMELEILGEPKLGDEFDIVLSVSPNYDMDEPFPVNLTISIPENIELLGGETAQHFSLVNEERLKVKAKATRPGEYIIFGNASQSGHTFQYTSVHIYVSEDSGEVKTPVQIQKEAWDNARRRSFNASLERNWLGIAVSAGILVLGFSLIYMKKKKP